jgi:hypothetical protein
MVDRDLVASKLGELAEHVARVRTRSTASAEDLRRDRDALDLISFNLMLAVQACADVASHVIADEGWPPATSLGAAFERLKDRGVITGLVCEALVRGGAAQCDRPRIRRSAPRDGSRGRHNRLGRPGGIREGGRDLGARAALTPKK